MTRFLSKLLPDALQLYSYVRVEACAYDRHSEHYFAPRKCFIFIFFIFIITHPANMSGNSKPELRPIKAFTMTFNMHTRLAGRSVSLFSFWGGTVGRITDPDNK